MVLKHHYRVSAIGTIGPVSAPVEGFSYGVSMARSEGEGGTDGDLQINLDQARDIAADIRAFHTAAGAHIAGQAVLRQVKVASIGPNGKYTREPLIVDIPPSPGSGISGNVLPQAALCVSLESERYGPTGKGRFFLPCPSTQMDSNFQISAAVAEEVRATTVRLLDALNDEPGIDVLGLGVCIASSKGYNSRVTKVRVGRVIDTMRSRRRALLEAYTAHQFLAGANPPA